MKDNSGPAFPCLDDAGSGLGLRYGSGLGLRYGGMTLRDYFAAKAMQAMLTAAGPDVTTQQLWAISEDSYVMADKMLWARRQQ